MQSGAGACTSVSRSTSPALRINSSRRRKRAPEAVRLNAGLTVDELVRSDPEHFIAVERIDARDFDFGKDEKFMPQLYDMLLDKKLPVVVDHWQDSPAWDTKLLSKDWVFENKLDLSIVLRNIDSLSDYPCTAKDYFDYLDKYRESKGTIDRLYAKDLSCFPEWNSAIQEILPSNLHSLSETDLLSSLPAGFRAENELIYFGCDGTYTPAHKDMCATIGQNIMVDASAYASSLWFMFAPADRHRVKNYLASLGWNVDQESHFLSIGELKNAPFSVYVAEQKLGDMFFIPSLSIHQVYNRGEYSIKLAWSRITVDTLELAINECLPAYRLIRRDETYKTKAIIYDTLRKMVVDLASTHDKRALSTTGTRLGEFERLFRLLAKFLVEEHCSNPLATPFTRSDTADQYLVTCSYCRADIFNRFLTCSDCKLEEDGYENCFDVCLDCYARGRSCRCNGQSMKFVEQLDWEELQTEYDTIRNAIIKFRGGDPSSDVDLPQKFAEEVALLDRKTTADVCCFLLAQRPLVSSFDAARHTDTNLLEPTTIVSCHLCHKPHSTWEVSLCSYCRKAYCYSVLLRAMDQDPFSVMASHRWKCPICCGNCPCSNCVRSGKTRCPYVGDALNVDVDFRINDDVRAKEWLIRGTASNKYWGDRRMQLQKQLETEEIAAGTREAKWKRRSRSRRGNTASFAKRARSETESARTKSVLPATIASAVKIAVLVPVTECSSMYPIITSDYLVEYTQTVKQTETS
ncbi:putative JmjC domain protein [Limtongia smithiae]|uniref:putative JmjC domain protein n=1 Tax=Limtongia smithiae TaxID=1125753 RepID=UPI0034CD7A4C